MNLLKQSLLVWLGILLTCTGFTQGATPNPSVRIQVTMQQKAGELWAHLTFLNSSKQPVYLNKLDIGMSPGLMNKLFLIKEQGQEVAYTGIMAKRRAPTVEDFVVVDPGKSVKTSIRLDQSYAFKPGKHRYTIQYSHFHGSPTDASVLNEFTSKPYFFIFTAASAKN